MLFNSFEFIFVFLPVVLLAYFGLNRLNLHQWAKGVLVLASLYFYAFFNTSYLPIIVSSILVNYGVAVGMRKWDGVTKKVLFGIGLLFNLGMLGYFKYTDFMIENVNALLNTSYTLKNILLPLGISFFTFQQLAFVGVTYNKANWNPRAKNLFDGIFIFSVGLAKKVIIADSIAVFANAGYNLDLPHYTMAEAWLISLSYTFQLYFDFSGYCDMAIGIGKMFNINLPLNFNAPYRATNFQDFWRR